MSTKFTDFPQYRMLSNGKVFYKITSMNEFIEVQFIGSKKMTFTITTHQYPEKLKIIEMLQFDTPYLMIDEEKKNVFEGQKYNDEL